MNINHSILKIAGLVLSLALITASPLTQAAPPQTMSYQAYLKDSGGLPVNSTEVITFRIYDALTAGTLLWSETLPSVVITDGLFSVELGATTALPKTSMDNPLWLSIEIATDGEASPRTALLNTNNAFVAESAQTLNGTPDTGFVSITGDEMTGNLTTTASIGIGTSTPTSPLHVRSEAGNSYLAQFINDNFADTASSSTLGSLNFVRGGGAGGDAYGSVFDTFANGTGTAYGVYSIATKGSTTGKEYAFYGFGEGYFSQDLTGDAALTISGTSYLADVRANAFYDKDDLSYFVNPASTSFLNVLQIDIIYDKNDTLFFLDPASTSRLNTVEADIIYDRNDTSFYLDPASTSRLNSMYASLFVDRDNPSFHLNPGNTSVLNAVTMAGTLNANNGIVVDSKTVIDNGAGWHRSYNNTGWFNGTHGGGIYMTDSTWVQTYNSKGLATGCVTDATGTDPDSGCFRIGNPAGDYMIFDSNEIMVRTSGGSAARNLHLQTDGGNVFIGGTVQVISDVNKKHQFEAVDGHAVLDRLSAMTISKWTYKHDEKSIRHIGPTAQDFKAAFDLGESDTSIATVDADGIALAAIKALGEDNIMLTKKLNTQTDEITKLRAELAGVMKQVAHMQNAQGKEPLFSVKLDN